MERAEQIPTGEMRPTIYIGVDEAGRGAVVGPLVIAAIAYRRDAIDRLKNLSLRDSKQYTPRRREELLNTILDLAETYKFVVIDPETINQEMCNGVSLNIIELRRVAELAEEILEYVDGEAMLTVDAMTVKQINCKTYLINRLSGHIHKLTVRCEHKADEKYPEVSAASILAKVTRDAIINKLKTQLYDFGSGYPSDPRTRRFLEYIAKMDQQQREKYLRHIRLKWKTVKKIIGDQECR